VCATASCDRAARRARTVRTFGSAFDSRLAPGAGPAGSDRADLAAIDCEIEVGSDVEAQMRETLSGWLGGRGFRVSDSGVAAR
jgi:hypothetical protein